MQQALTADRERVLAFLREQGFTDDEVEARPLRLQDLLAREYGSERVALRFNGQGQVVVKSTRVDLVAAASNRVDPLIEAGISSVARAPMARRATSCLQRHQADAARGGHAERA